MIGTSHNAVGVSSAAETINRQDVKDAIARSQAVLKVSAKYRTALFALAGVMQDMAEAVVDLGRARAVKLAEKSKGYGIQADAMRECGEFQLMMSKRMRDYGDRMQRDLEEPLQSSIEEHAQTVTSNDKRLVQMEREISDKIKKADVRSRKRWNRDPQQTEQASRDLTRYTTELSDLKFFHQNIIVGEEARHLRVMEDHWANLVRPLASMLAESAEEAANCANALADPAKNADARHARAQALKRRGASLDSVMGDGSRNTADDAKPQHNSLGRRVAKLVGVGAQSAPTSSNNSKNASPKSPSTSSPSSSSATGSPKGNQTSTSTSAAAAAAFPQLSLPSFSPLSSNPPSPNPLQRSPSEATSLPRPIIKSASGEREREKGRRVAFPTSKPIATVQQHPDPHQHHHQQTAISKSAPTLSSMYPEIFAAENTPMASVVVRPTPAVSRNPAVYVAGGEGDAHSQIGSVVGTSESLVGVLPSNRPLDLVYAIHDFAARSAKEMSLRKGDVMEVKKRHGTWIYGTKFTRRSRSTDGGPSDDASNPSTTATAAAGAVLGKDRYRRGVPQEAPLADAETDVKPEVGWIPMAFVAKFSAA
ncbi:hypothetical protein HKX48_000840 [Thoreauomyces humboldtii]|nr:hypothetical protein HKX48_000840 [Thoreauomyces humboldtii]